MVKLYAVEARSFSKSSKKDGSQQDQQIEKEDETTFYKRPLSEDLISFSSQEGKKLFREAMIEGNMENYFPLSE